MKKSLLVFALILLSIFSTAQTTATNFNCNDCLGNNHDLFNELNSGKVVVICWVMPCINCASKALAAYNVCQSYTVSNPGQVVYYIADDFANTNCTNLKAWADTSVAVGCTLFSNSLVSMSAYGIAGMPKTVVLSGATTHSVYFNQNGAAAGVSANIKSAVDQALADILAGVKENNAINFELNSYPNPASKNINVAYTLTNTNPIKFEILSVTGQRIKEININSNLSVGKNESKIDIETLANGIYYLKISSDGKSQTRKISIYN